MAMTAHERFLVEEMAYHLAALQNALDLLNTAQTEKTKGMSTTYRLLARRFRRTLALTEGELEYGLVAHLDGRLPGPTAENDAANALGHSSQNENADDDAAPDHERL